MFPDICFSDNENIIIHLTWQHLDGWISEVVSAMQFPSKWTSAHRLQSTRTGSALGLLYLQLLCHKPCKLSHRLLLIKMISLAIETFHFIKWQKFRNGPFWNIHSTSETDEQSLRNTLKDENQFFLT